MTNKFFQYLVLFVTSSYLLLILPSCEKVKEPADERPVVVTKTVINITTSSATVEGEVKTQGTSNVIESGICWGTESNPTINDNKISTGTSIGSFSATITGLWGNSTYQVRAYASNTFGVSYGENLVFNTLPNNPTEFLNPSLIYGTLQDVEGNTYATIQIGTQTWMAENLKTSRYDNGSLIPNVTDDNEWMNLTTPAWCNLRNKQAFDVTYGKLYNWYTVSAGNLCPAGWHVPTESEWTVLTDYLGGAYVAGGKLKAISNWNYPNVDATNETGFSGLPGGYREALNGDYDGYRSYGTWWSSSDDSLGSPTFELVKSLGISYSQSYLKSYGRSVRCLKD
jgi:uncharacterized protein (TIGR02145 family)